MADDVLRAAGFVEGLNYRRQTGLAGGGIPDITFLLPGGRELHMDVKFPIDNYLRHLDAVTDGEGDAMRARFLRDVRDRVRELARRRYGDPSTALDHVLLFIPNESVWGFVLEHDPALIDLALSERVVLCSPTTLVGVLAVLRQSLDDHLVERTSGEILECLEAFEQQWDRFGDALDGVGRKLETTTRAFEELTGPRRRQLQRTLDRVDALREQRSIDDGAPGAERLGEEDPEDTGDDDAAPGIPRLVDRRFG
jgi:DNA recombination protein RmuC